MSDQWLGWSWRPERGLSFSIVMDEVSIKNVLDPCFTWPYWKEVLRSNDLLLFADGETLIIYTRKEEP